MMLTTPGGTPASSTSSPRRSAVRGASSAGFNTMVQPGARAGEVGVRGIPVCDSSQELTSGRISALEGRPGFGIDPFAVDEKPVLAGEERSRRGKRGSRQGTHLILRSEAICTHI